VRLLIVGYGRMGKVVDALSGEYGMEIVGRIDVEPPIEKWPDADVAIDFSVADAVPANVRRLAASGVNVVIGTPAG
jgi:Dihydrodipicolinate reductase